ncbi:YCII-related domain protein [Neohortaea acidophila]|uniref:YCII-related domain protein n=1 Tax=Neohortaea acidophila TaxID=245834 RepID=A0A6A6PIN7_9PEZI|nr:YCII-related domain protein [Neohortaea acidophila]KAF2479879.1 YCII-related domain protein [Neohortaea acidophila]
MAAKPEWLVLLPDFEGALDKRMEVRPKHLEAIKPNVSSGKITLGGATLDEQPREGQPMKINGSAMLVSADSKEDVMKLVESDVYYESRVWDPSKIQVFPFKSAVRTAL